MAEKKSKKPKKTKKSKPKSKPSKSNAKTKPRSKKNEPSFDSGIIVVEDDLSIDKEKELEERRAYLEEARSQEASD